MTYLRIAAADTRRDGKAFCILRIFRSLRNVAVAAVIAALVWLPSLAVAADGPSGISRAIEFMKNRQYNDAIKVLSADIQGKADNEVPRQLLLLGQCQYVTKQYDLAQVTLGKALRVAASEDAKADADFYLTSTLYRLRDYPAALERIDGFAKLRPSDPKVGKLLVFKMLIVAAKGAGAQADLEAIHAMLYRDIKRYDAAIAMEADEVLSGFYRQHGMGDKAFGLYSRIVGNLRNVISESEKEGRPVPASLKKAADNAALNLGAIALERKQPQEAQKWLENVRFDSEMIAKARLYLAKLAFEKQEWTNAIGQLTRDGFIDTVPAGQLKSDMFLIMGMAEKNRKDGNPGRIEEWLKQVGQDSRGYPQAQSALGDLYREKAFQRQAIDAYTNALVAPDYAANALFALGVLTLELGEKSDANQGALHFKQSGEHFAQLFARFPLSAQAKLAKPHTEILAKKGINVAFAANADDQIRTWEKSAKDKAGTNEGAQALISLARQHAKVLSEEKTGKVIKAADWVACAAACDRLLDAKAYPAGGPGAVAVSLRSEALFLRGTAEGASVSPAKGKPGDQPARHLDKATAEKAVELLGQARALTDPKNLELIKVIDLAQVEAMFKSADKDLKTKAEARFGELEANYGNDPRFQALALGLAGWYQEQGRLAEAAKQYAGVADRSKELAPEELMKLYAYAGSLFSQAGITASRAKDASSLVIYLYPALSTPRDQLEEPLKTLVANAGVPESELRKVIRAWEDQVVVPVLVAGPFANPGGAALGLVHGPESDGKSVNPRAVFTDNVGKPDLKSASVFRGGDQVRWQKANLKTSLIEFHGLWPSFAAKRDMAAYVATWVQVAKEQDALLCLGSDDGIKVWLNGGMVHENAVSRRNQMDQDKVKIRLRGGTNLILAKVTQSDAGWALNLRLATLDGLPLPEATYGDAPDFADKARKGKER